MVIMAIFLWVSSQEKVTSYQNPTSNYFLGSLDDMLCLFLLRNQVDWVVTFAAFLGKS